MARISKLLLLACIFSLLVTTAEAHIDSLIPCLGVPCRSADRQLPPGAITAGAGDFTLRILGRDLESQEQIQWNGAPVSSDHISEYEKQVVVRASMIATPGQAIVTLVGFNSLTFRINTAPVIATASPLAVGIVGAPIFVLMTGTGGTLPYTWSGGSPPPGLLLSPSGVLSGTPLNSGTFTFLVRLTDAALVSTTKSLTFPITSGGAPVALDDEYITLVDKPLILSASQGVLQNDLDPNGRRLTAVEFANVRNGTLTPSSNGDGSFTFTPNLGFSGEGSFTYRASNGTLSSNPATVRIAVLGGAPECQLIPQYATLVTGPIRFLNLSRFTLTVTAEVRVGARVDRDPLGLDPNTRLIGGTMASGVPVKFTSFHPYYDMPPPPFEQFGITRNGSADFFVTEADFLRGGPFIRPVGIRADGAVGGSAFTCAGEIDVEENWRILSGAFGGCLNEIYSRGLSQPRRESVLATLRRFRDQVLSKTEFGREYTKQYYRFSPEAVRIALRSPGLILEGRKAQVRFQPLIEAALNGRQVSLSPEDLGQIGKLLKAFQAKASPEFRRALEDLWSRLNDARFMAQFGVNLKGPAEHVLATARTSPEKYSKLPLSFEAVSREAGFGEYRARGLGYALHLKPTEAVLGLAQGQGNTPVLRMRLAGSRSRPRATALDELPGKTHYLTGRDPATWRTDVRQYGKVRYDGVYPGVDLVYYGNQRQLEYDFILAPQAKPDQIRLSLQGVDRLSIDQDGDLVLGSVAVGLRLRKPVVYQTIAGRRREVEGAYRIGGGNQVGFAIGPYDVSQPLVIDPVLSYAGYLGGGQDDYATAIAVDSSGNTYITGFTTSENFALRNPLQSVLAAGGTVGADVFVTKLNPAGNAIEYSTYFGGSNDDIGLGLAVDTRGNAYVTGATRSTDLPLVQPVQSAFGGAGALFKTDAFVAKLNATGSALIYSTYLGGTGDDGARGIAVDAAGNAYIAGVTSSTNFPVANALQPSSRGGTNFRADAFVSKLNAAGSALVYSTYLGGAADDAATAIGIDASGNAYLTGLTYSRDFPLAGPIQRNNAGSADIFVSKLSSTGSALTYSTYLGGTGDDLGTAIALDAQGSAHLTGTTGSSTNFPLLNGAQRNFGNRNRRGLDAFVAKLNPLGSALQYSTFLGGSGYDIGFAIAADLQGNTYIAGETDSVDFASAGALQSEAGGLRDGFVAKLLPSGNAFEYRTLHGGSDQDSLMGIAVDPAGSVYLAGGSGSEDSPATFGALQPLSRGRLEALVTKLVPGTPPPKLTSVSAATVQKATGLAPEAIATGLGERLVTETVSGATTPLPTTLAGASVRITDSAGTTLAAGLLAVSPGAIRYLVPPGLATGLAAIAVMRGEEVVASGTARIHTIAPGLFSADGSGRGVAAAIASRVSADGTRISEPVFECGAGTGKCVSIPFELGAEGEQMFLQLFGTGIRGFTSQVTAAIGGVEIPVASAGPQGDPGLDEVNIGPLPISLVGRGELDIVLTVDGKKTNPVMVNFR